MSPFHLPLLYQYFEAQQKSPLTLVALHGRGDSMKGLLWIRHHLRLENFNYLFLNAPDDWDAAGTKGFSWYAQPPEHHAGIERSRSLLQTSLEELNRHGILNSQILVFGFSQGCILGLDLALRQSSALMGLIGISGMVYQAEEWEQGVSANVASTPILMTHGFQDSVLPYERTKTLVDKISPNLPNLEFHSLSKGHFIANAEFDLYRAWIARLTARYRIWSRIGV